MLTTFSPIPSPGLSLEPILRCPTCGKTYHEAYVQRGIVFPECQKCDQKWWTMLLRRGPVLPQLVYEFEDASVGHSIFEGYRFPAELPDRRFWQIPLKSKDVYAHRESSPALMFRSLLLIPRSVVLTP